MISTNKLLIALLTGIFVLCGCEKPINLEEMEDTTTGNVTVSVYKIENSALGMTSRGVVSDVCTKLNFAIYDAGGTRVKQINQKVSALAVIVAFRNFQNVIDRIIFHWLTSSKTGVSMLATLQDLYAG